MIEIKDALLAATLFLIGTTQAFAQGSDEDVWTECRAANSCTIEYDHLANQHTDPFMFSGHVVDRASNKWRSHHGAIRKYADVRDCLVDAEQEQSNPNLLLIDWAETGFDEGAEVCVFRIARSLGSIQLLADWFEFHGFRVTGPHPSFSENYKPRNENDPVKSFAARWSEEEFKSRKGVLFDAITLFYPVRGFAINIRLSEDNQVVSVGANWVVN